MTAGGRGRNDGNTVSGSAFSGESVCGPVLTASYRTGFADTSEETKREAASGGCRGGGGGVCPGVFSQTAASCLDPSGTGGSGGAHGADCFWTLQSFGNAAVGHGAVDDRSSDRRRVCGTGNAALDLSAVQPGAWRGRGNAVGRNRGS